MLGRAHSSLKLSSQVLWLSAHSSMGNKACAFSFYFANVTEDILAKGKRKKPLSSSVEISFFFSSYLFPLLLSTKSTSHKNDNWSSRT